MKRTNTILAAAFLVLLFAMAGYTLQNFDTIRTDLLKAWEQREDKSDSSLVTRLEFTADRTEGLLNAALDREHRFIELYGGLQKLTRQKFIEDSYSYSVIRMNNGSLTFGRNSGNCVRLADEKSAVSGNHCILYREGGKVYLKDLGSTNGTFFSQNQRLKPNQAYRIGKGASFFLTTPANTFTVIEE